MAPQLGEDLEEVDTRQEPRLIRALEMVAPGTELRQGIDNILHSQSGTLCVIADDEDVSFMFSGGISLGMDYTPAILYQLAKMDGALILSVNATKINWANVQLMPDPTIYSSESGTRHRTAERVSKQADALVVCISKERDVISLYVGGTKYILEDIPALLSKAKQALATLDKYRSRYNQVSMRLTSLEFAHSATLHDVLTVLQRAELVTRMSVEIERHIVELGTEGRLIEMQLEESTIGVAREKADLVRDYVSQVPEEGSALVLDALGRLTHQDLLDFGCLAELLGYDRKLNTLEHIVTPRGYRVMGRIPRLPQQIIRNIVHRFNTLYEILEADDDEIGAIDGVGEIRAKDILEGLSLQRQKNFADNYQLT